MHDGHDTYLDQQLEVDLRESSSEEMGASNHLDIEIEQSQRLLDPPTTKQTRQMWMGYMGLGLANNSTYVIILAVAKRLSEGGVGLVYFVNIFPGLLVKLLFPYVAHYFSFSTRIIVATVLMIAALLLISYSELLGIQLIGVAGIAMQSSGGEATALAMTSKHDGERSIAAWGCGTGLAGLFGYFWVFLFGEVLNLSTSQILLTAQSLCVLYIGSYLLVTSAKRNFSVSDYCLTAFCPFASRGETPMVGDSMKKNDDCDIQRRSNSQESPMSSNGSVTKETWGAYETLTLMVSLWRIAFALCLVYFSEYTMMTGTWSSMGSIVQDEDSRQEFYMYSNWCYQFGVWVSRTWGLMLPVTMPKHLWYMSFSQFFLLLFFLCNCYWRFWTGPSLYPLCGVAGLFGGATYVNAFALVSRTVPNSVKDRALGGISVSDTFGIVLADLAGLLIQGCMYRRHDISGAEFKCGA